MRVSLLIFTLLFTPSLFSAQSNKTDMELDFEVVCVVEDLSLTKPARRVPKLANLINIRISTYKLQVENKSGKVISVSAPTLNAHKACVTITSKY